MVRSHALCDALGILMVARSTETALPILDMISEFRFPDADRILRGTRRPAQAIARLKARVRAARVPVIYVNDTAGKWESDPRAFV
jgi:nicotinamidase-related amidase